MTALLSLESVEKRYDRTRVLHGVDVEIGPGEFVILIGGSGSGKTTLLRVAAGLERASAGAVRLRGRPVDQPARGVWVPPERRGLGMVFQDYALWPHMDCRDNVMAAIAPRSAGRERAALAALERVGMGRFADRLPGRLSGGQQQRVGIARALAARPDLLLLDEPLSSLDVDIRDHLRLQIRALARDMGMAALFVSHEPLDVWRLADRVLVLERGRLSQAATPQELYARPATPRAARFAGAHGGERLAVESESGRTGIRLGAVLQPATVIGLAAGEAGIAYVRPQGVRMAAGGIPARLQDCAFEAGQWRARWRLADCPLSVFTLEQAPPPAEARLELDEAHVFIYRAEADTADD